jgi:hypothetical protein
MAGGAHRQAEAFDKAHLYLHGKAKGLAKCKLNFPDAPYCATPFEELGTELEAAILRYRPKARRRVRVMDEREVEMARKRKAKLATKLAGRREEYISTKRARKGGAAGGGAREGGDVDIESEPKEGLRVRARFDAEWVKGVITEVKPGQIFVAYDDGDEGCVSYVPRQVGVWVCA